MSAPINKTQAKALDHSVKHIIAEMEYRDYRIIQTDDEHLVGQLDAAGFRLREGFVVRDAFDEPVFPIGMSWFYTPYDAIAAIEMLDTILPAIKEDQPATALQFEYGTMWAYRRAFHFPYFAIIKLRGMVSAAAAFGDDLKTSEVNELLHALHQNVCQSQGGVK